MGSMCKGYTVTGSLALETPSLHDTCKTFTLTAPTHKKDRTDNEEPSPPMSYYLSPSTDDVSPSYADALITDLIPHTSTS